MAVDHPDPDATQRITDSDLGETLATGQRVFSRFVLEVEIGRGGMGVVWRARDEMLGEAVALKFLPTTVARDAVAIDELKDETRRARRLTHENIVRIHDFVQDTGTGAAAIAMELVEGTTLAELRLQQPGKVFSVEKLAPLVAQICAALDYAHTQAKVAHRDLKPANVLVTADGRAKIVDFGIARSLTETQTRLTGKAGTSGTLLYMSPQQLRGQRASPADDIYALGATLYELLTGKPPFYTGEIVHQILHETPEPLAARRAGLEVSGSPIPLEWEQTVLTCLAKRPEERRQTAGEIARRLGLGWHGRLAREPNVPSKTQLSPQSMAGRPLLPPSREHEREPDSVVTPSALRRVVADWGVFMAMALIALVVLAVTFWPKAEPKLPTVTASERKEVGPSRKFSVSTIQPTSAPREFAVTIDPPDADARLWLGPQSDLAVPSGGRALVRDLPDGEHELVVQASGYQPYTTRVTVNDGRGNAEAKLVPIRGTVEVIARSGTVVTAVDARGRETRIGTVPRGGILVSERLLMIGSYTLKFTHDDCAPVEGRAELVLGRMTKLAPKQVSLPGELRVFSVPIGAEVRVNSAVFGRTPATLTSQPSETELEVEVFQRGFRRATQSVTLKPREIRTLNVGTLVAESGALELWIADSGLRNDPKLTVRVDGKPFERDRLEHVERSSPVLRLAGIEVGARAIEIAHPDYEPLNESVTVRDNASTSVNVKLAPKPATLVLQVIGPSDYMLSIDGKTVPVADHRATVPAIETLALEISAQGYKSATRRLALPANGSLTWEVALENVRALAPGQPWTIPDLGAVMLPIAPGTFILGSERGLADEKPATRVTISEPFWLGKTEVTQRAWVALMESNPSHSKGDELPVEQVSWDDAMAFCRKLSERERAAGRLPEGFVYTLPTEAQWEYVCRAETDGDFAGNVNLMAWYSANSGGRTHPAGLKQPNAWGLHDMHGNVWEWCLDWYGNYPGGAVRDLVASSKPPPGSRRVNRGGGWSGTPQFCRSAVRGRDPVDSRNPYTGFRLALAAVLTSATANVSMPFPVGAPREPRP